MKTLIVIQLLTFIPIVHLISDEVSSCHRCEVIREQNKKKVNPYAYYEDYLKDHPEEAQVKKQPQNDKEEK